MYDEATETSPLLPSDPERGDVSSGTKQDISWSSKSIILALIVVVVLVQAGDQLMESPQTRIIESVICYRYYEQHDPSKLQIGREGIGPGAIGGVAEMFCKEDVVQGQLALLRGYQQLFDGFPSLLMAMPLGWAADRYGRKPFVLLGLASCVVRATVIQFVTFYWQAFDIRMTWLSTLHGFMGGSTPVLIGLYFVVVSDVTPEATRSATFLRISAFNLFAALCMQPLA